MNDQVTHGKGDPEPEDADFEDVVAALLKVDAEGITGQRRAASKKDPKQAEKPDGNDA